jgi:FkbM family methyltransferase
VTFVGEFVSTGDLVFDVGANRGDFARACSPLGVRVVCVEPQPHLCDTLRTMPVEVVQAAVGEREGSLTLHLSDDDRFASGSQAWVDGHRGLWGWQSATTTTVPMLTLDMLISRFGEPAFVKVDTERFEDRVMAGLSVPVRAMSLEYVGGCHLLGADDQVTVKALTLAAALADYRCRFAAESSRWVSDWLDLTGALALLPSLDWGDVYLSC